MPDIPKTMRSLLAPRKCNPNEYEVQEVATPQITLPSQVLIRVHAAAISTGEHLRASGRSSIIMTTEYPYRIGIEGAGVVVAVGSEVKSFKVGDEVYGACGDKPMGRNVPPGFASEYALALERQLIPKPAHVSFEEATSLLTSVATAEQVIRHGLQLRGEESLEGKTVYIPAGLSSTGSVAIQVAKHIFGASKIITTVSTPKLPLVEERLPGLVDQIIDYKTQRLQDHVPKGSVDFAYNTQFETYDECISLLNPDTGILSSIASLPSRATMMEIIGADRVSWWLGLVLDAVQLWYQWKARGTNIKWEFVSGSLHHREYLERAGEIVALGKVKAVMTVVQLNDIDAVRAGCEQGATRQGGTGKLVIKIC